MTTPILDALVEALEASTGLPVPTSHEFAERIVQQLDARGFEIAGQHPSRDDDPDDFQRGCYGPGMVDWQPKPPEPVTIKVGGSRPDNPVEALRAAYWTLRRHASSYRATTVFQRRQALAKAEPHNAVLARGAARDEWYARGFEAAADDIAEIITLDYEADVDPEPTNTAPYAGGGS